MLNYIDTIEKTIMYKLAQIRVLISIIVVLHFKNFYLSKALSLLVTRSTNPFIVFIKGFFSDL